ncbi:MAG: hypothetical protein ACXVF0_01155 [Blastococcus sp.]
MSENPYGGPPATRPNPAAQNPYGQNPYGQNPYGYPGQWGPPPQWPPVPYGYPGPWGPPPPRGAARPGQVITTAVLSFVQAALVLFSSLYLWMLLSIAGIATRQAPTRMADSLVTEGTVLAVVQVLSVVVLVLAGVGALTRRSRAAWLLLLGAHGLQVVLTIYWAVRLQAVLGAVPEPAPTGAFTAFTIFFTAAPLVAIGLVAFGPGRRWFDGAPRP